MGPAICKVSKDAVSQSARQPFRAAWATLSECLLHIKEDVAAAVTMINAEKTSHLRPVASPLHAEKGSRSSDAPEEPELQPAHQMCACSALCRPPRELGRSQPRSRSHSFVFLVRVQIRKTGLRS